MNVTHFIVPRWLESTFNQIKNRKLVPGDLPGQSILVLIICMGLLACRFNCEKDKETYNSKLKEISRKITER